MTEGPLLPLEFARQSADGRMTLVITDHDAPTQVLWARLDVQTIDQAVEALAEREGVATALSIGREPTPERFPYGDRIAVWAEEAGHSGVVWTALKPGMTGRRGGTPPLGTVLAHLEALEPAARSRAAQYVQMAPQQILTPWRRTLHNALGLET